MSEEITIAEWETHPYTSYDKRGRTVKHRVRVLAYDTGFVDVTHERIDDSIDEDWKTVEYFEVRDHGTRYEKRRDGVMAE